MTRALLLASAVLLATAAAAPAADPAQCAAAPLPDCVQAKRATLRMDTVKHRLEWKWVAGKVVDLSDLGNPAVGVAGFDLCLYDAGGALLLSAGVGPGGTCSGQACWRARWNGFRYQDKLGQSFGITKIKLKAALGGNAKLAVSGRGDLLARPAELPAPPVTAQLVRNDDPAVCWTSTIAKVKGR